MADEEIDEPTEEPDAPDAPDEEDLDDEEMPFSLDDEAEITDDDGDGLDEEGGAIDLEVALAIEGGDDQDVSLVDDEGEDDEEVEDDVPVKEGEFVCNGCYMVFRVTAMADTKAQLCRDCA